ncbi:MAG: hypothetical protein KatS3mg117_1285 [Geminicoccaceae bacterium]|nr:MAG: hypothetical protein KatS3mg117_1285 [Geminicoccaceae bacterium]
MRDEPVILDTVTKLRPEQAGRVAVCASHGGLYAAWCAAVAGVRAVVLCDAGIGKDEAGVAGLRWLDELGLPAVALDHDRSRIGDGRDAWERGVASRVNRAAAALGAAPGQRTPELVERLRAAPVRAVVVPPIREARVRLDEACRGDVEVWACDSAALVRPEDRGRIVVTGSHGGLLGGRPESAIGAPVFAALFNDAGIGIDEAGTTRLPALDERGIAAATVDAETARIGDARSTFAEGIVSRVNRCAAALGGRPGMPARELVALLVDARLAEARP